MRATKQDDTKHIVEAADLDISHVDIRQLRSAQRQRNACCEALYKEIERLKMVLARLSRQLPA